MNLNSAITERDKKLIYGLLFIVIIFFFGWCLIRPLYKAIVRTSESIEEESIIRSANESKVIGLESARTITDQFEQDLAESTADYYPIMDSSEIDKLVTTYILEKGLTARSLSIQMPTNTVSETPYIYSDIELDPLTVNIDTLQSEMTEIAEEEDEDEDHSGSYFSDAVLGFLTGYQTEKMTIVASPVEEYTGALSGTSDTASSGIYCVTLSITVEGDEETEQKVIDELSHNPSLRLVNFNWITLDPITYLQEDGSVLIYESDSKILAFTVNLYMTDKITGQEDK